MIGIYTKDELIDGIYDLYETGGGVVFNTGFKSLAKHYQMKQGGVTDVTGYPGSGKSEFMLELLGNTSKFYGHKHLIHMPDAGTVHEVIAKLIHKRKGMQFKEFFYNENGDRVLVKNRLPKSMIDGAITEVLNDFIPFKPSDGKSSKAVTPVEFWEFAASKKEELNIFSAVIDSWNYMKHDTQGFSREDKWLESTLSRRNDIAEQSGVHFVTIIHPRGATKDQNGEYVKPTMHSLKGGSEWANNAKSIIIVHREGMMSQVDIAKAKPEIVGVKTSEPLMFGFELEKGKFFEFVDGEKQYAQAPRIESKTIKPNLEF